MTPLRLPLPPVVRRVRVAPCVSEAQRRLNVEGAREVLAVLDATPDWRGVVVVVVKERKSA